MKNSPPINRVKKRVDKHGKTLWRLAQSQRNEDGDPRQKPLLYWGSLPTEDLDRLLARYNESRSDDPDAVAVFLGQLELLKKYLQRWQGKDVSEDPEIRRFYELGLESVYLAMESAGKLVAMANQAFELGLAIKELIGCERVTKNRLAGWLQKNPDCLKERQIDRLMFYVKVSNRLNSKVTKPSEIPWPLLWELLQLGASQGRQPEHFVVPSKILKSQIP